jgi:fructokinase
MENPSPPVFVLAAGEALIDLVEQRGGSFTAHAGGAVYNLARALALQRTGTAYLNRLSCDRFGRQLADGLHLAGVALADPQPVREPTSLATVQLDGEGKPAYSFYREGIADRVGDADALIAAMQRYPTLRVVCTGGLALAPEDSRRYLPWLQHCRNEGLLVVVDANLRPSIASSLAAYRASVRAALALADVIKVSDDDLAVLLPEISDPLQAASTLFSLGHANLVALTRGAEGASLLTRDGRSWRARETAPLQIVDTVGAGDCFLAGLLSDIVADGAVAHEDLSTQAAKRRLARAIASASLCVQRAGCQPPTSEEVRQWMVRGTIAFEEQPCVA